MFTSDPSSGKFVLQEFKAGKSPIMTATDVAARGLGGCNWHIAWSGYCIHLSLYNPGSAIFKVIYLPCNCSWHTHDDPWPSAGRGLHSIWMALAPVFTDMKLHA